jgi:hypothetical protein
MLRSFQDAGLVYDLAKSKLQVLVPRRLSHGSERPFEHNAYTLVISAF